jgi:hypothetical protein
LNKCPKIISYDLESKLKEFVFIFDLYHKMPQKDFMKIFKGFPYIVCLDIWKVRGFLA